MLNKIDKKKAKRIQLKENKLDPLKKILVKASNNFN